MINTWPLAAVRATARSLAFRSLALLLLTLTLSADTLGFIEQKFSFIDFEKGKWERAPQALCYTYSARQDGAVVEVLRIGTSNLVPFKATKGLAVTVCGSTAIFDEGFEAGAPILSRSAPK
ncbi:MAG: hypothetical protein M3Y57_12405 [Acidobacteriota bacterium]|nr:hypothetical protein [Acidobacteriota bacterium]